MDQSTGSTAEAVHERLRSAGYEVRCGFRHGWWHMVAERDEAIVVAVSGMNPDSVADCLMRACPGLSTGPAPRDAQQLV
jgi:hypothetical protein